MPRNGKLVRISLAVAAAAAVAVLAVTTAGAASAKSSAATVSGAGSTFVAPLVNKWIGPVASIGITLNYNAIGSTGGVQAITTKQVDFGASDAPLTQFNPTCTTCVQIPWALAATSVIYNLHGFQFLKMTGPVLAKIYMGAITKWNDPAIKALNPGKALPSEKITVVHRSDGSGTSYNFTDYLSHVSAAWNLHYGTGTSVSWWPGSVGVPKSSGVSNAVKTTPGAIGYVDVDYAVVNHLGFFRVKNRAGNYVLPKLKGIRAAAQLQTKPNKDGSLSIVNPPKSKKYRYAYPISTYTYVDVQKSSGGKAAALKQLITWAISKGQAYGGALFFARLPGAVVHFDKAQIAKIHS